MNRSIKLYKKADFRGLKEENARIGISIFSITKFINDFNLIEDHSIDDIIDISAASELLSKQLLPEQVLYRFDENIDFICDEEKWNYISYEMRHIFSEIEHYYIDGNNINSTDLDSTTDKTIISSDNDRELLFYDSATYSQLEAHFLERGYVVNSISKFIPQSSLVDSFSNESTIIDISCLTDYTTFQSLAEGVIYKFQRNTIYICDIAKKEKLAYNLRFVFNRFVNVEESKLFEGNIIKLTNEKPLVRVQKHRLITELKDVELEAFFESFRNKLYGHPKFKNDFVELVETFRAFNKIGEHKILSLFLMGESGVGKTEVARTIFECMGGGKRLAKINFGNYSNEFSLSSLIGSARGYIGSDDGEIFMKVRETDVGVLLIDEFEKSNATLFNYFLDVLESGKMTSSLGGEIDLNGFIIIFTSNISKDDFSKRISPELRSRFDYKCMFTVLSNKDKQKYLEFRTKSIVAKISHNQDPELVSYLLRFFYKNINVADYNNMRDLNKMIKKILLNFYLNK